MFSTSIEKTTTARKTGQVYYDVGFLSSAEVAECSASDFVSQYVGQTGPETRGVFEKALGKVFSMDEAYRLSEGHFAKEAMDELVGIFSQERFKTELVVILEYRDRWARGSLLALHETHHSVQRASRTPFVNARDVITISKKMIQTAIDNSLSSPQRGSGPLITLSSPDALACMRAIPKGLSDRGNLLQNLWSFMHSLLPSPIQPPLTAAPHPSEFGL